MSLGDELLYGKKKMAQKNWRISTSEKERTIYTHKNKRYSKILIRKYLYPVGNFVWNVNIDDANIKDKSFKTKSAALKYAKEYMRKH